MNLYPIKYLIYLLIEGEKTSKQISDEFMDNIYQVSRGMRVLNELKLVNHPPKRARAWIPQVTKPLVSTLEKLILVSKNNQEILVLLNKNSFVIIGDYLYLSGGGVNTNLIIDGTGLTKGTVIKNLNKLNSLGLLQKTGKRPYLYIYNSLLSKLFYQSCHEIIILMTNNQNKDISPDDIMKKIQDEDSVLILVHYGSSAHKTNDEYSDVDIFVVTRDKISRGEILDKYRNKKIDLNVYSKKGFFELIKTQPHFVANIMSSKILKGEDLLKEMLYGN